MNKLIPALAFTFALATGAAWAQPFAPNQAGITMGHWHLNSKDVEANRKIFVAMGGVAGGPNDRIQRVVFPGVVGQPHLGAPNSPPAAGGTQGSVGNHVGFIVKNLQEQVAKWKAAGVNVLPGNNGRQDQAYVETPDGVRIEILEDKNQAMP